MYRFNIVQNEDGTWRFELDGIHLILEGYEVEKDRHLIKNPAKAIAYFDVKGHVYGLSNQLNEYRTVEDFYEIMRQQYSFFAGTHAVAR